MPRAMKIGLFGGTFDPPHVAHLAIAEAARSNAQLDKVIWIPASEPPHRTEPPVASPFHRLEMTRLSIQGNSLFEVSDIELRREGKSYTVDTLRQTQAVYPNAELRLIIGGDSLRSFHTWRDPDGIRRMADLIVYGRDVEAADSDHALPDVPLLGLSSSKIRKMIAAGRSIRYLVHDAVAEYIRAHRLYTP